MNNLFDLITKSGYDIQTIGTGSLPCTIMQGDDPVAIMMPDFSLRMVSGKESDKRTLDNMVSFSLNNQGEPIVNGEYCLSSYMNVCLTTSYDLAEHRQIYHVYRRTGDAFDLIHTDEEQTHAAEAFARSSGMIPGDVLRDYHQKETDRLHAFFTRLHQHGFREEQGSEDHMYDIVDKDGRQVGYIRSDDRVVVTADDRRIRKRVSDIYRQGKDPVVHNPEHFSRWKQLLRGIGYCFRTYFDRDGATMHVRREDRGDNVAQIDDNDNMTYTEHAQPEEEEKLSEVQQKFREEFKMAVEQRHEEEKQQSEEPTQAEQAAPQQEVSQTEHEPEKSQPQQEEQAAPTQEDHDTLTQEQKETAVAFEGYSKLLITMQGFQSPRVNEIARDMMKQFGTTDPKEFADKLLHGDYNTPTLDSMIGAAQRQAQQINTERTAQKQPERTTERSK